MNHHDIIDLLTAVRAGDNRTVGQGDVEMWLAVIADVPKAFAMDAVIAHRRERPGVWLEPGHIAERWAAYRRGRLSRTTGLLAIDSASANTGDGIERRELSTGDEQFRFYTDDAVGLWRSTRCEAQDDADRHRRTA